MHYIIEMGNKAHKNDDFHQMVHNIRKDNTRRININPQKKFRVLMLQKVQATKLPNPLKTLITQTLNEKITEMELIQTVTCINALRNNEFDPSNNRLNSIVKDKPESKFVTVNFGKNFLKKILGKQPAEITTVTQDDLENQSVRGNTHSIQEHEIRKANRNATYPTRTISAEEQRKQKLKIIGMVLKKQLNRISHPFGRLNKAFAQYIEGNSKSLAPEGCKEQVYESTIQRLILQWCNYLQGGCLNPYRKWIITYTNMEDAKYMSWIRNLLLQEIWAVNNGYLFGMLTTVIQRCKTKLTINNHGIQQHAAFLTPSLFSIDPKLQIQGHFFDSIYEMSEIVGKVRPEQILQQLETVKKRICTDIDNYHRLVEKGQVYEIDSDNILGIVAYILCKIASKIDEIHTHLIFLRVIYGEKVYYSMNLGSYMLSTVFGATQFLQSEHFNTLMSQNKVDESVSEQKHKGETSETKGWTSRQGEEASMGSQGDRRELQVSSLLSTL